MTELQHFYIGDSYGGNQDWMRSPWMKLGGCAALAAVDSCIYFTVHRNIVKLCPEGTFPLSVSSYNDFAELMRPYLPPRFRGVNRLSIYTAGFYAYLRDRGCTSVRMDELPMGTPRTEAEKALKERIDAGYLVPILHLVEKNQRVKDYHWHWFLLNAYREEEDGLHVRAVTYSSSQWLLFDDLWNEHDTKNGGLILYSENPAPAARSSVRAAAAILCDREKLPTKVLACVCGEGEHKGLLRFPSAVTELYGDEKTALKKLIYGKLGVAAEIGTLINIAQEDEREYHLSMNCYLACIGEGSGITLDAAEYRWLTRDELHSVEWCPEFAKLADVIFAEMTDASTYRPKPIDSN